MSHPSLSLAEAERIGWLDAHDQAALVAKRELSPAELVEAAIMRIEARDPEINAVTWRAWDIARQRAAKPLSPGPLAGVPYLLKDSIEYPGMPARAGSRLRDDQPGTRRLPLVERYDHAGLVPIGKSAMPEFALLPSTEPLYSGATRNPWDRTLSVGGSSGGAAAAVAAGMVPLAHASDGAGSIRIPASCCGLVGLKPGRARNARARAPDMLEDLMCGDALLARTVRDAAAGFAIGCPDPIVKAPPRPLRIALQLMSHDGEQPHPAVAATVTDAAHLCEELGHQIVSLPPSWPAERIRDAFHTLWAHVGGLVVDFMRNAHGARADALLEPWTLGLAEWRDSLSPDATERLFQAIGDLPLVYELIFEACDVILSPVVRDPPPRLGHLAPDRPFELLRQDMLAYVSYTPKANLAGLPSISLPLSRPGLRPMGAMFTTRRGGEPLLLALAASLEAASKWKECRPAAL